MFMLREPSSCEARSEEECTKILYAYSSNGGKFVVNLPGNTEYEAVETGHEGNINGSLTIELEPEQARVFVVR